MIAEESACDTRRESAAPATRGWHELAIPALVIWLMILGTFTPWDRENMTDAAGADTFAKVKLLVRLVCLAALSGSLLTTQRGDRWRVIQWYFAPLAVYIGWAFVSALWSPLRGLSIGQAVSLLSLWVLGLLIALRFRSEAEASYLFKHATLAMMVFNFVLVTAFVVTGGSEERFSFRYAHPTAVGSTASIALLLLVMALLVGKWSWAKWLFAPGVLIHMSALILAESRTALGLLVFCVGLSLLVGLQPKAWALLTVTASLLFASYLLVDGNLEGISKLGVDVTGFVQRGQSKDELAGFSGRGELWEVMWESHSHAPWLGHGYFVTSRTGELEIWGRETNFTAHNMFFQALVTTGYIGCALFCWAFFQPVLASLHSWRMPSTNQTLVFIWLNFVVWSLGWGTMDPGIVGPIAPNTVVLFAALGLIAGNAALASNAWARAESHATFGTLREATT